MPYGQRYRRRPYGTRRRFRRSYRRRTRSRAVARPRVGRVPRSLAPSVYYFKRKIHQVHNLATHTYTGLPAGWLPDPASSGSSNPSWTIDTAVNLSMVNDTTDFSALFESYKITGVKEQIFLSVDPPIQQNPVAIPLPAGYYKATPLMKKTWRAQFIPTGAVSRQYAEDLQRGKSQMLKLVNRPTFHRMMQATPVTIDGAGTEQLTPSRPRWIPTAVNNVAHYGARAIIYALTDTGSLPNITVRRELTVYIACRGVR